MLVDYPNQFVPCDLNAGINRGRHPSPVCVLIPGGRQSSSLLCLAEGNATGNLLPL